MKVRFFTVFAVLMIAMTFVPLFAAGGAQAEDGVVQITLADKSWDSILVHNRIVEFILEEGYGGYEVDFIPGDTIPLFNGVASGDIDITMESWHSNYVEAYEKEIASGRVVNIGKNMPDGPQGWWMPRYMLEGDTERGIAPMTPGLSRVEDLRQYVDLLEDRENPGMGRIIFPPPGWSAAIVSEEILVESGLDDVFTGFLPGSGTALAASMKAAYQRGEPWVGYYWEPTAIMGELDMVRVPGTEFPTAEVDILMNAERAKELPEVVEFLSKYQTTVADNNEFLYVLANEVESAEEAAQWFLENKEEIWTPWVSDEVAANVRAALQN